MRCVAITGSEIQDHSSFVQTGGIVIFCSSSSGCIYVLTTERDMIKLTIRWSIYSEDLPNEVEAREIDRRLVETSSILKA